MILTVYFFVEKCIFLHEYMRMQKKYWARSPPERFSEMSKNFQEAEMDKYNDELKMQFSAYETVNFKQERTIPEEKIQD